MNWLRAFTARCQLDEGTPGGGHGGVSLWRVISACGIHRDGAKCTLSVGWEVKTDSPDYADSSASSRSSEGR
jgi:hypothetical protein